MEAAVPEPTVGVSNRKLKCDGGDSQASVFWNRIADEAETEVLEKVDKRYIELL